MHRKADLQSDTAQRSTLRARVSRTAVLTVEGLPEARALPRAGRAERRDGNVTTAYRPCKQGPRAANDSGPRTASAIRWAVIHSAEASDDTGPDTTAEGVAAYFARPDTQASTQLAVDRDSCVRMLPDLTVPWAAPGANTNGLHVEICGRAGWTRAQWLEARRRPMLDRAAYKVAAWCHTYKIPRRWVGPIGLRLRRGGLTTHADVTKAFPGGTHWDPGPNFPRELFLELVQHHYAVIAGKP